MLKLQCAIDVSPCATSVASFINDRQPACLSVSLCSCLWRETLSIIGFADVLSEKRS
jgi:hypothetical protein